MSGVDVIRAMRVAEAYCIAAGAVNAGRAMEEARAAIAELIEAISVGLDLPAHPDRGGGAALYFSINKADRLRAALAHCRGGAS